MLKLLFEPEATTGPSRTPTSQGCRHLSARPFLEVQDTKTNKVQRMLMNDLNFIEFHLVYGSGFLCKKGEGGIAMGHKGNTFYLWFTKPRAREPIFWEGHKAKGRGTYLQWSQN